MKKILIYINFIVLLFFIWINTSLAENDSSTLYYGNGCPHCAKVEELSSFFFLVHSILWF